MSSVGWLFFSFLVIIPLYDAAQVSGRSRRSIMDLNSMVKSITGRDGSEFIGYGNWCGLGGSGRPVDPIDECCQIHDLCYDLAKEGVCKKKGEKAVYQMEYKWKKSKDGKASCEEEKDQCKAAICMCDAIITNCIKSNLDTYDDQNLHKMNLFEMIKEADWLTS